MAGRRLKPIDWEIFDKLCEMQCTINEIAGWFDCSIKTIQSRVKNKFGLTFNAYFEGKRQKGKIALRRAQFQKATEGNPTMLIWLGKQYLEQVDRGSDQTIDPEQLAEEITCLEDLVDSVKALPDDGTIVLGSDKVREK